MQGLALHEAMTRYDKAVGYPMAWFFHMLTIRSAPHALANAVIDDVQAGFHYLPDRDVRSGQGVAVPALRLLTALSLVARFAAAQAGAIVRLMSPPPSRVSCRVV
jgi:hypothetical protein